MKIKITKTDEKKINEGVEVEYEGVKFRIARWKNDYLLQVHRRLQKKKRNRNINLEDPEYQRLMIEKIADKVVLWFETFQVGEHTIEYNRENTINLLTNDPDCLDFISDASRDLDLFLEEDAEAISGE